MPQYGSSCVRHARCGVELTLHNFQLSRSGFFCLRLVWLLGGAQLPTRMLTITQSTHSGLYTYIWAVRAVTNPVYVVYNIYGITHH